MQKKKIYKFLVLCFSLLVFGCAGIEEYSPIGDYEPTRSGIYHKIQKGETLWRIAKTYQVDIERIIRSNNIPDVAHIENNQLIFVPGATSIKEIVLDEKTSRSNEFIWPIKGKVLFYFGQQNNGRFNKGIGIRTHEGEAVHASRDGRVVLADYLGGYGQTVILDHGDGFFSVYAQNSSLLCRVGDRVTKGKSIAQVGMSGDLAYLHFEIRQREVARNPLYYLP